MLWAIKQCGFINFMDMYRLTQPVSSYYYGSLICLNRSVQLRIPPLTPTTRHVFFKTDMAGSKVDATRKGTTCEVVVLEGADFEPRPSERIRCCLHQDIAAKLFFFALVLVRETRKSSVMPTPFFSFSVSTHTSTTFLCLDLRAIQPATKSVLLCQEWSNILNHLKDLRGIEIPSRTAIPLPIKVIWFQIRKNATTVPNSFGKFGNLGTCLLLKAVAQPRRAFLGGGTPTPRKCLQLSPQLHWMRFKLGFQKLQWKIAERGKIRGSQPANSINLEEHLLHMFTQFTRITCRARLENCLLGNVDVQVKIILRKPNG